jgi:diguanylate cyclase (GGDEF)-like protein
MQEGISTHHLINPYLADHMPYGLCILDKNLNIILWNKTAEELTDIMAIDIVGNCCNDSIISHYDNLGQKLCHSFCLAKKSIEANEPLSSMVYISNKEELLIPIHLHVQPLKNENGDIIGVIQYFHIDMSQKMLDKFYNKLKDKMENYKKVINKLFKKNEELNKRLVKLSNTDNLTGLYNRRYFHASIQYELQRAKETRSQLSLLIMDIDYFKQINDKYGHLAGDKVLVDVVKLIQSNLQKTHIACRYGGEEFVIILPNTDTDKAYLLAEKIREDIEKVSIKFEKHRIKTTISTGIAFTNPTYNNCDMEKIIARADEALYRAKNEGRNRTLLYSDGSDEVANY